VAIAGALLVGCGSGGLGNGVGAAGIAGAAGAGGGGAVAGTGGGGGVADAGGEVTGAGGEVTGAGAGGASGMAGQGTAGQGTSGAGGPGMSVPAGPRRNAPGDGDWAQLAYSPINTSSTTARVPENPTPLFDTVIDGEIAYTTPVVGDGRLFFTLYPGGMVALNAGTGAVLWQQTAIGNGKYGTAAYADGRVFTVGIDPTSPTFRVTLVALDASTGSVLWSAPAAFSGILKLDRGRLYMTLDDAVTSNHVVALDAATGAIAWEATEPCDSPPAIHDDRIYCVGTDKLVALDAADGTLVYAAPSPPSSAVSAPAVVDGRLFYVGARLYVRSILDGAPLWDADFGAFNRPVNGGTWIETSPAVAYGKVFVVGAQGVFAFDAGNGAIIWRVDAPATFQAGTSVAVADGRVLLSGGTLLDADDGRSLWSATAGRVAYSTPIITDGHFYGGTHNHVYGWGGQVPGVAPAY
jgi:outer membrane protein assembly factor BamB